MYWTLHSIQSKDLADEDRRYLLSQITSVIEHVVKAQVGLADVAERLDQLLSMDALRIVELNVRRDVLSAYKIHIDTLMNHGQMQ